MKKLIFILVLLINAFAFGQITTKIPGQTVWMPGKVGIGVESPTTKLQVKGLNYLDSDSNVVINPTTGVMGWKKQSSTGSSTIPRYLKIDTTLNNYGIGKTIYNSNTTGANNIAIGKDALYSNVSSSGSVGIGYEALKLCTVASNSAVGYSAGAANTVGDRNAMFGYQAGAAQIVAQHTAAFGWQALQNSTGNNNTGLGAGALRSVTTGYENTAIGSNSGISLGGGSYQNVYIGFIAGQGSGGLANRNNVGVGWSAMTSVSSGLENTCIGSGSGLALTTGSYNSMFGRSSGTRLTTALGNTFLGYNSAPYTTSGGYNIGLGFESLYSNTTGTDNISIGYRALYSETTGVGRVAIGTEALYFSTGDANTAVGYQAGKATTSGRENSFFGYLAGTANTTGVYNTFIGRNAGKNTTTSGGNTAIGAFALETTATNPGTYNTATGSQAMNGNIGSLNTVMGAEALKVGNASCTENVAIGYQSGYSGGAMTSAFGNSLFGSYSGASLTTGGRNILLGYAAGWKFTTQQNRLVINDRATSSVAEDTTTAIIYGLMSGTTALQRLVVNGKMSIGNESAGNYTSVEADGTIKYNGNATVWDDAQYPFTVGSNAGTGYPTFVADSGYYTFVIDTTGASKCIVYYNDCQLTHRWKEGSTVYPHIHYKYTTTTGTPTFGVKYRWFNRSETPGAWTWIRLTQTTGTTDGKMEMSYNANGISGAGKTISSILQMQVYLISQTGTGGIFGYGTDVHFEMDTNGSRTETSK